MSINQNPTPPFLIQVGELIDEVCKRGESVTAIATRAGVHRDLVSRLRNKTYRSAPSLANIEAILKTADMNFSNIVKTTIFLIDMADFATVNEIYGKRFLKDPPARSTVAVSGLPKGVRVEIEVTACT